MNFYKALLLLTCLFPTAIANAQLSTLEPPVSFSLKGQMTEISRGACQKVTTPSLDMAKIEAEDKEDEINDVPPRFGFPHIVSYDLKNSGTWYKLPNGDKLWQLNVVCPNALSVNFCYDKFWIPEGGKFFVYSKDRKHTLGAFTSRNNKGTKAQMRGFATGIILGNNVVLEYYQPKRVIEEAVISINKIVHGYKDLDYDNTDSIGSSGSCNVNINCSEGQNWQDEKNAIAKVVINGSRVFSGALMNATDLGEKPYFLTAHHCIAGLGSGATSTYLDDCLFYWGFEAPGCSTNANTNPNPPSTNGATIVSNNALSDFALLLLDEDPKALMNYTPYYLGWDRTGQSGDPGVCIHHPHGDVKKISTVASQPLSDNYNGNSNYYYYWRVFWDLTPNGHGMTEGGSSGAPLLNAAHRVVGQLAGGDVGDCSFVLKNSYYGKFDVSWTGASSSYMYRRLDFWLDSIYTNQSTMEGLLILPNTRTIATQQNLYSNVHIINNGQLNIYNNVTMIGTSKIIVESGCKIIINGGKLSNATVELKPGATLRILNGGILETRSGFESPVGAIVDIDSGQIL